MKKPILWILGVLLVTLPFTWTYLLGFATGTHHTCLEDFDSNKTGLTKHSLTIEESRDKKVFIKTLKTEKEELQLDSINKVDIKNIWVESAWKYECLDTGLTVISLNIPTILIEINDCEKFYDDGFRLKHGDDYAGFYSGILGLSAGILSADTVSLIVTNKDGKKIDRIRLIGEN